MPPQDRLCTIFCLDKSVHLDDDYSQMIDWAYQHPNSDTVLGRVPNSEQSIFNGLKMPKSGKTALNCLTIFQYYLHNLPCFAGDLVYF